MTGQINECRSSDRCKEPQGDPHKLICGVGDFPYSVQVSRVAVNRLLQTRNGGFSFSGFFE